ncbi:MAG: hypothetical protein ABSB53_01355 [Nitrososphaerales archaeon]|jgi:Fe-S cluster assembly iron-binding protein IscA
MTHEMAVKTAVKLTERAAAELKLYLDEQRKLKAALRVFSLQASA